MKVRKQIEDAEIHSGRPKGSVRLCAVSKFHPQEDVYSAIEGGQLLFGENRVQEAYGKFPQVVSGCRDVQLHIIGQLQTNKVKKAVEIASCIQSVDREDLLKEIEKQCAKLQKNIEVYFEIHTGEESKSGYGSREELFASLDNFMEGKYPHVKPAGLMTMAPFTEDKDLIRKSFSSLRLLREELNKKYPTLPIHELSMGMSGDYEIAIEEGSTMVRVGTALFGERDYGEK